MFSSTCGDQCCSSKSPSTSMAWEIQKTNHGREASRPQKLGGNETRPFFSQAKWRSRFKTISSWMDSYGYR